MQIQILSITTETKPTAKGSYQMLEIAYKNLTFSGKVESKKIMSFGAGKMAFDVLANARPTEVYDIDSVKNDKGYLDWTRVVKGNVGASDAAATASTAGSQSKGVSASSATTAKGGWETPEERKAKQVYIVRQSSLSNAIAALSVGSKVHPTVRDILDYAKQFEEFVFSVDPTPAATLAKEVKKLDGFEDELDIPF